MGNALEVIDLGTDFDVDHVSCGYHHTCALSTSNELKCFGRNDYGQLGYGHTDNIGNAAGDMGDFLSSVDVGTNFVPIQVDCGSYFTCALSTDFGVKCWGRYIVSLFEIAKHIKYHTSSHHISFLQQ